MIEIAEDIHDDLVRFTQKLIRIPSYTGKERELAELLLGALKDIGVDEAFIDGIGNVVGVIRGQGNGPNILMNGHLDIVPPGNIENWHGFDPFGAEIDEHGNIHGRGAADLKGGLSVQLFAMKLMKLLIDKGRSLSGNLIFSAVVHEEAAEMFGMKLIYLEAGSGASRTVPDEIIRAVISNVDIPVIVGGGIRNPETVVAKVNAGASFVVVGNHLENNINQADLKAFVKAAQRY